MKDKLLSSKNNNLLITTIGERGFDTCKKWTKNRKDYDVLLIYYDSHGSDAFVNFCDFLIVLPGFKYPSINKILTQYPEIIDKYEYFFLPDDDITITSNDIDSLFHFAKSKHMAIAQPSILPINYSWLITVNNPHTEYRYVSMVEIMCPIFSRAALSICLNSFSESKSGWGLETAWSNLLKSSEFNFAVYDEVKAVHSIPIDRNNGHLYKSLKKQKIDPVEDLNRMVRKYKSKESFIELSLVYKNKNQQQICDFIKKSGKKNKDIGDNTTLALQLNWGLIIILNDSLASEKIIQNYYCSYEKTYSYLSSQDIHLLYQENKTFIQDLIRDIENTFTSNSNLEWFKDWFNLCRTLSQSFNQKDLTKEPIEEILNLFTYSIGKHLNLTPPLDAVVMYFMEQSFLHRKKPQLLSFKNNDKSNLRHSS